MFKKSFLQTPFGSMIAVADDNFLYLLQFTDSSLLAKQLDRIQKSYNTPIVQGSNTLIKKVEEELALYYSGTLKNFTIRLSVHGTEFQNNVWRGCAAIDYGSTIYYQDLAQLIDRSRAYRAVGTALGANCHALIIPCHRVIKSDGIIGNYAGGTERKRLLVEHEKFFKERH
jgi:AraC family transcriptional regulator of adaptative response/methylated-DNA-[protein]-cysteine methyltransferase